MSNFLKFQKKNHIFRKKKVSIETYFLIIFFVTSTSTLKMLLDREYLELSPTSPNFETTWLGVRTVVDWRCNTSAEEGSCIHILCICIFVLCKATVEIAAMISGREDTKRRIKQYKENKQTGHWNSLSSLKKEARKNKEV